MKMFSGWIVSDGLSDIVQISISFDKTENTHFLVKEGHFNLCGKSGGTRTNNSAMVSCIECLEVLKGEQR